jgi:hypothetical protein
MLNCCITSLDIFHVAQVIKFAEMALTRDNNVIFNWNPFDRKSRFIMAAAYPARTADDFEKTIQDVIESSECGYYREDSDRLNCFKTGALAGSACFRVNQYYQNSISGMIGRPLYTLVAVIGVTTAPERSFKALGLQWPYSVYVPPQEMPNVLKRLLSEALSTDDIKNPKQLSKFLKALVKIVRDQEYKPYLMLPAKFSLNLFVDAMANIGEATLDDYDYFLDRLAKLFIPEADFRLGGQTLDAGQLLSLGRNFITCIDRVTDSDPRTRVSQLINVFRSIALIINTQDIWTDDLVGLVKAIWQRIPHMQCTKEDNWLLKRARSLNIPNKYHETLFGCVLIGSAHGGASSVGVIPVGSHPITTTDRLSQVRACLQAVKACLVAGNREVGAALSSGLVKLLAAYGWFRLEAPIPVAPAVVAAPQFKVMTCVNAVSNCLATGNQEAGAALSNGLVKLLAAYGWFRLEAPRPAASATSLSNSQQASTALSGLGGVSTPSTTAVAASSHMLEGPPSYLPH